jgi:hypothetical protein
MYHVLKPVIRLHTITAHLINFFFNVALLPNMGYGLRRATVGTTSLRECSVPSQRPLPDNTQHSQQTNIHAPVGFKPAISAG